MLARAAVGDVEGDYRRHWLLMELLEMWFVFRGVRYQGSKQAFVWLETYHPGTFALFEAALKPTASLAELAALANHCIN